MVSESFFVKAFLHADMSPILFIIIIISINGQNPKKDIWDAVYLNLAQIGALFPKTCLNPRQQDSLNTS